MKNFGSLRKTKNKRKKCVYLYQKMKITGGFKNEVAFFFAFFQVGKMSTYRSFCQDFLFE